jgi:hypothetical protein
MNAQGDSIWSRSFPGYATGNNSLWGPVISTTGSEIYYTASFQDTVGTGVSISTLKYDPSGTLQWSKFFNGGIPNGLNLPAGIKLDKSNNIYVCGTGYYQTFGNDYVTVKYQPSGALQWVARYSGLVTNGGDYANDLAIDTSLTVFVTGNSRKSINSNFDAVTIKYNQPLGIAHNNNSLPIEYHLSQNYPNPFNGITVINYEIPKESKIHLTIYNLLGQEVKKLVDNTQVAGYYSIAVNMNSISSGIYFYKLMADADYIESKKMILIK